MKENTKNNNGTNTHTTPAVYVSDLIFETWREGEEDTLIGVTLENGMGKISVLDRLTGWGNGNIKDIETGYRDASGNFCLASGDFDIREFPEMKIEDAIEFIKSNANTVIYKREDK